MNNRERKRFFEKIRRIASPKSVIGIMLIYIGIFLFLFPNLLEKYFVNSESILETLSKLLPLIFILIGSGVVMFRYLEGGKKKESASENDFDNIKESLTFEFKEHLYEMTRNQERNRFESKEILKKLEEQLEQIRNVQLNENQKNELFNTIKESFADNVNDDFFKQLNENISIDLTKEKRNRLDSLQNEFQSIKKRLFNEIESLGRKANVNLVIGSMTTIIALIVLAILVFQNNLVLEGFDQILYHYLPRLSLIIFIEVFAYFFLRLYKLNLNDIKFFQNELTTVELKLASITTAINFGRDIDISSITNELSKTERNFRLKKGETSIISEKEKNNQINVTELVKIFTDVISKTKN